MKTINFVKTHELANTPRQIRVGDAGFDLTCVSAKYNNINQYIEYDTGIAVEIPEGHVGLVFPRSSISNTSLSLANSVGVIDSNYRGSIKARFRNTTSNGVIYQIGERCCQLIILQIPSVMFEQVNELSDTNRGEQSYGSSGTI